MPLFLKNKLVFIHIPKTGGTSIEQHFDSISDPPMFWSEQPVTCGHTPQHVTYAELKERNLIPGDFRIFTVVRHPYQRFLSEYNYRRTFNNYEGSISDFAEYFFAAPANETDNHNLSMAEFLFGMKHDCKSAVILYYEDLKNMFRQFIGEDLNIHALKSVKFQTELTDEIKELIYSEWNVDFRKFNYKK